MISPASAPRAVNPRMRSLSVSMRAFRKPRVSDNVRAAIREGDLDRFGPDEASGPDKQLRPALLETSKMHLHHSIHHLAFAIAHTRHADLSIILSDSDFSASPKVGGDLCAMDDIFARHTGDVGTGASYIFSLNHDHPHSLFGQGPGQILACFAAAEHDDIIVF